MGGGSSVVLKTKKEVQNPHPPSPVTTQGKIIMHYYEYCYNYCLFLLLDCVRIKYPKYDHKPLKASLGTEDAGTLIFPLFNVVVFCVCCKCHGEIIIKFLLDIFVIVVTNFSFCS